MSSPPIALATRSLRVVFQRQDDRFAHRVESLIGSSDWVTVLQSVENQGEDHWPSSPPLQEVHRERRGAGSEVALCIGMAGTSHWSLSALADVESDCLRFEVATRVKTAPKRLSSTYDKLTSADEEATWQLEPSSGTSLICEGRYLVLSPEQMEQGDSRARTITWEYCIRSR